MKPKALLIIVAFAAVAYFIFTGKQQNAERTAALPGLAETLGLSYSANASPSSITATRFPVFQTGEDVQISNVMQGQSGAMNVNIFDLDYRTVAPVNEIAGNENPNRTQQTVVLVSGNTNLPDFVLRPNTDVERWIKHTVGEGVAMVKDKAGDQIALAADQLQRLSTEARGYTNRIDPRVKDALRDVVDFVATPQLTDINFDASGSFSDKYLLTGPDEVSIRQVFKPAVLDHLAGMSVPMSVEARGGELIAYRAGQFASEGATEGFMTQVKTLYTLLSN